MPACCPPHVDDGTLSRTPRRLAWDCVKHVMGHELMRHGRATPLLGAADHPGDAGRAAMAYAAARLSATSTHAAIGSGALLHAALGANRPLLADLRAEALLLQPAPPVVTVRGHHPGGFDRPDRRRLVSDAVRATAAAVAAMEEAAASLSALAAEHHAGPPAANARRGTLPRDVRVVASALSRRWAAIELFVNDPASCFVSRDLLRFGFWEPVKTTRILRLMRDAPRRADGAPALFVDVGANIGWYALLVAAQGHRVIAVEPLQRNVQMLVASAARNGIAVGRGRRLQVRQARGRRFDSGSGSGESAGAGHLPSAARASAEPHTPPPPLLHRAHAHTWATQSAGFSRECPDSCSRSTPQRASGAMSRPLSRRRPMLGGPPASPRRSQRRRPRTRSICS